VHIHQYIFYSVHDAIDRHSRRTLVLGLLDYDLGCMWRKQVTDIVSQVCGDFNYTM